MDEITKEFDAWYLKKYGCVAFRPSASQKELADTRMMLMVWRDARLSAKDSIKTVLEEVITKIENYSLAEKLVRFTMSNPVNHAVSLTRVIADEVRSIMEKYK
jgi:malonyl CoA-acyl carrier protein transacylase